MLLCLCSFLVSSVQSHRTFTKAGTHCPTSSVQKVAKVVYEKDCCGRPIAKVIEAKPEAGDKAFKQCRCAESKTSSAHDSAHFDAGQARLAADTMISCWVPEGALLSLHGGSQFLPPVAGQGKGGTAPPTPPPQFFI